MASLILGALPIPTQTLAFSSRISFSQSETLSISLPSSTASLPVSTATTPSVPSGTPPRVPVPVAPPKKDKFEDDTIVKVEIDESLS
ncbi:30S ribosomal protein S31, chloroplastic [Prunus avium]|uniref:30S ribosomal protein S31, chloroplastic n=1 Tax=Prunus avium TaxID=42229 RepID=A0A6P5T9B8_PRUAV|nr:30S ribosomal protein S31, chloroplastic [Prunus avium]